MRLLPAMTKSPRCPQAIWPLGRVGSTRPPRRAGLDARRKCSYFVLFRIFAKRAENAFRQTGELRLPRKKEGERGRGVDAKRENDCSTPLPATRCCEIAKHEEEKSTFNSALRLAWARRVRRSIWSTGPNCR